MGGDTWKENSPSGLSSKSITVQYMCVKLLCFETVQEAYTCSGQVKWLENWNLDQEALESHISHRSVTWLGG